MYKQMYQQMYEQMYETPKPLSYSCSHRTAMRDARVLRHGFGLLGTVLLSAGWLLAGPLTPELQKARDAQNREELERIATKAQAAADKQASDAEAQYRAAVAQSTLAEVATEVRDKNQARAASEAGIRAAERAVNLKANTAEYHRIYGTLCGQGAAAIGGLGALKYGKCALDEVNKALQLDPKSALNHLSHGVGNYYLPQALGGGVELAIKDFEEAIKLDPKSADAHLWLAVALRKLNRNPEARKEFEKAIELNPARAWAKDQLAKTP
jgi:tetratricopeptide (TPR) repeat protein